MDEIIKNLSISDVQASLCLYGISAYSSEAIFPLQQIIKTLFIVLIVISIDDLALHILYVQFDFSSRPVIQYINIYQLTCVKMSAEEDTSKLLPVTLLCGFLGAGKTTLLKHVLETKHAEEGFRCAVIVNDMASLNIDKSLIDQSALVQTDEVIIVIYS